MWLGCSLQLYTWIHVGGSQLNTRGFNRIQATVAWSWGLGSGRVFFLPQRDLNRPFWGLGLTSTSLAGTPWIRTQSGLEYPIFAWLASLCKGPDVSLWSQPYSSLSGITVVLYPESSHVLCSCGWVVYDREGFMIIIWLRTERWRHNHKCAFYLEIFMTMLFSLELRVIISYP